MTKKGPIPQSCWEERQHLLDYAGLLTSLPKEHDYQASVEGQLPSIRGTLYRNGPGLFHRGRQRKRMALDGDGMIQAFDFDGNGHVRFRNRFVRTDKFQAEERAGAYLYPTWSTLPPGPFWRHAGTEVANQAGITVLQWADELYALDEGQPPYRLNPMTLETLGKAVLDSAHPERGFLAHWKMDSKNKHWLNCSLQYGKNTTAFVTVHSEAGQLINHHQIKFPRTVYMHDWFASENYFIFILHPAFFSMSGLIKFKLGLGTASEMIQWKPREGTIVCVVPRTPNSQAKFFEIEASWVWHAFNAFDDKRILHVDFVGASSSDGGVSPILYDLMAARDPKIDPEPVSFVRRYVIDLGEKKIQEQIIAHDANYEMPFVSQHQRARPHRFGYVAKADPGKIFWSSVARVDFTSGAQQSYRFSEAYCSEPVFVPESAEEERGWILTVVYRPAEKRSLLAVLDAEHLNDGPQALVKLRHHLPLSFHGSWSAR